MAMDTLSASAPALSILLVNYNGKHHLEECFATVFAQGFRDFEVVMVDNASRDGSIEFTAAKFPQVRIVPSATNLGFAGGNNLGLSHCRGRHVLFLNNDTAMDPLCLERLMLAVRQHPQTRVFACLLARYDDHDKVDSAGDTIYRAGPTFSFSGYPVSMMRAAREVTSACAAAACYEKGLLDRLRGFDEDLFLVFEDLDLSLRARHLGEKILLVPGARVFHKGSASMGGTAGPMSVFYSERNYALIVLKNFPLPALIRFAPALIFIKAFRAAILLLRGRAGTLNSFLRGNLASIPLIPRFLAKRRQVLSKSTLDATAFFELLRPNWWSERRAFRRGDLDIPL